MAKLSDLARLLRSKNAGPFQLTLDVMLGTAEDYRRVIQSGALTPKLVGDLLGIEPQLVRIFHYEPAFAIKITVPRRVPVGDPLDNDLFGGQLFGPLAHLEIATDALPA
jgi:hypothetical protein